MGKMGELRPRIFYNCTNVRPGDEMWGLIQPLDKIMEFASVVTDGEFNLIKEGPEFVVHISENDLLAMDEWCTRTHG